CALRFGLTAFCEHASSLSSHHSHASEGNRLMLRVLGSPKKLCSGPTRRDMLQVGALGFFGLGLHDFLRLSTVQAAAPQKERHFGKAKACILLHLYGSPSQIETVDMKPAAPPEIHGEFKP